MSLLFISFLSKSEALSESEALRWDLFFQPLPIFFLVATLGLTAFIWFIWNKGGQRPLIPGPKALGASSKTLKEFYALVPAILGTHVGLALLFNGINGRLLAFNNLLQEPWSNWIGLAEIGIALSLFYGGLARFGASLLACIWLLGFDLIGLKPMLEGIQYFGFACFFYLAGRGPYAIDRLLFPVLEPTPTYMKYALFFLRISIGLNFIVFGFTQKLANIPFALSLIEAHRFLNFINLPNEIFVLFAGSFEVLVGLLIAFGIFFRLTIILALLALNASLTITSWAELMDYLPLYGALAVLLVWEPTRDNRILWTKGLIHQEEGAPKK
nr:DoxX family membrane protein [Candidatus Protochlamydia phocaeensis]